MASKLVETREKLHAKQKEMAEIWAKYPDLDMSAEVAADIKARNDELTDISKSFEDLQKMEEMRQTHIKGLGDSEQPAPLIAIPQGFKMVREPSEAQIKSLGQMVAESDQYKFGMKQGGVPRFQVVLPDVSVKTLMTTTAGYAPETFRSGKIVLSALRRPVVGDLIPTDDTTESAVRYMEETTFTNNAAPVAEGGTKPESALAYTERTVPVEVIATWIPVTRQQLDDVSGMQGLIDNRLTLMLKLAEESQLLNGNGTSPQLTGFYNKSGVQTQAKGADPGPDAIYKAMTKVRTVAFAEPSGVVMHPSDWQDIRLLRTVDGIYIWGSPADEGPERVWGLPVIQTTAATENTVLLGDFGLYSHISRRQGVTIDVTDSHSDYFIKNQLVIRIEERLSLEIYRGSAFCLVTGM